MKLSLPVTLALAAAASACTFFFEAKGSKTAYSSGHPETISTHERSMAYRSKLAVRMNASPAGLGPMTTNSVSTAELLILGMALGSRTVLV